MQDGKVVVVDIMVVVVAGRGDGCYVINVVILKRKGEAKVGFFL